MDKAKIKECLTGPIPSICTPFKKQGEVDFMGLRRQIDFLISAGAKTMLLTVGDSHYDCLSEDEIAKITRVTCEQTAGRAMVVAADRNHGTARAIDFAEFAKQAGADIIMCMPPNWGNSCTPETLAAHYAEVSKHLPVMIVTNRFIPYGIEFGIKTIKLSFERSDSIVAIKDDMCGEFARKLCMNFGDQCPVFAGGQKQNFLDMWVYGCKGYLTTFLGFKPEVTKTFWNYVQAGNITDASRIVKDIDMPYFDYIMKLPGSFDAGIHATYELFGITGRWRRPPYYSLNDTEMEKLKDFFMNKKIL
jgi:4-hydroxy-tetrahydrodipicolinate synthase